MNNNYGTLLVVDDNSSILTAVKICTKNTFGRIVTLTTPEAMLATLQQEHIDVILLDMNFAHGTNSGQEGMIWLSAVHRKHPDIPVVLMTAYADIKLAVRGLKNGAVDFVTKPWDNDELIRVLKDAVDHSKEVVPLDQVEKQHVKMVVDRCRGNMSRVCGNAYGPGQPPVFHPAVPQRQGEDVQLCHHGPVPQAVTRRCHHPAHRCQGP